MRARTPWRINRIHAIEENIFALRHSESFAKIESAHPEIHAAMVQALSFRTDFKLLLKLQSLRQPVLAKEKVMTATT